MIFSFNSLAIDLPNNYHMKRLYKLYFSILTKLNTILFRQSPVLIVLFVLYALLKIGGPWNTWPRRVYKRRFAGIRPFSIGSDGKKVRVNLR